MVSPYVRRQQLTVGLTRAREAAGLTHAQVGAHIGQARQKISRLENGHVRPVPAEIFKILQLLDVTGDEWAHLVEVANGAADHGWWTSYGAAMGRQALYADLESGAELIREFQPFIPGLLQTSEFAEQRHIAESDPGVDLEVAQSRRAVEARQARQQMLMRPGGSAYEVVLDEVAIRRLPAPPDIVAAQLRRLVELSAHPKITVRILAVDARIGGYRVARSAFSLYAYPGPRDPEVVAVDTVTADTVLTSLTEEQQVRSYTVLYERLADAAMSPDDSSNCLSVAADRLV